MPTIEIDGEIFDALAMKWLYEVADTQVHTILAAGNAKRKEWDTIQDCVQVLTAVNRLLEYYRHAHVDLAKAAAEKASDV